jgi:hypothetical protein
VIFDVRRGEFGLGDVELFADQVARDRVSGGGAAVSDDQRDGSGSGHSGGRVRLADRRAGCVDEPGGGGGLPTSR